MSPEGSLLRYRVRVVMAAAILTVPCLAGATAAEGSQPARPAAPSAQTIPVLDWSDCEGGFECAPAHVPLDHRVADGLTLPLAVIRRPVAEPARRIGTLVLQPGGPGGSGLNFVRANYADLPAGL